MSRFSRAGAVWRALRARVFNLDPGNPWRVVWNPGLAAYMLWAAERGVLPMWLAGGWVCVLIFGVSWHALLMRLLADRLEQRCVVAERQARVAEERVRALQRGAAGKGYCTRSESRGELGNMN